MLAHVVRLMPHMGRPRRVAPTGIAMMNRHVGADLCVRPGPCVRRRRPARLYPPTLTLLHSEQSEHCEHCEHSEHSAVHFALCPPASILRDYWVASVRNTAVSYVPQWDIQILQWLQGLGAWLYAPMQVATFVSSSEFLLFLLPMLYWCVEPALGLNLGVLFMTCAGTSEALKLALHRPRPYWLSWPGQELQVWAAETTFAMPSGHTQNGSAALWLLASRMRGARAWALAVFLAFLVGCSRVYLGVHWPSDVALGWLVSALLFAAFERLRRPVATRLAAMRLRYALLAVVIASMLLLGASITARASHGDWRLPVEWAATAEALSGEPIDPLSLENASLAAGMLLGVGWGALLMNQRGGFSVSGSLVQRTGRLVIGFAGMLPIWLGLARLFPESGLLCCMGRYLTSSLVGLWVSLGAPLLFRRMRLARGMSVRPAQG